MYIFTKTINIYGSTVGHIPQVLNKQLIQFSHRLLNLIKCIVYFATVDGFEREILEVLSEYI